MSKDLIPEGHEALYGFAMRFFSAFLEKRTSLGLDEKTPDGKWVTDPLLKSYTEFNTAYTPWANPVTRTKVISAKLRAARDVFEPLFRQLIRMLKSSPLVSDPDLVDMGLAPRHSGGKAPSPVAEDYPAYRVETPRPFQVTLHFDHKPYGQHGVEILWSLTREPASLLVKDLTRSSFDTRSPFHFELDDSHRGQHLYFAIRWENTRGEKGPWSPVDTVIVP
jgi:hypothetical protein